MQGYHDLIIRGASVIDGTGSARHVADVAVFGDRIAGVGDLSGQAGTREIHARGRIVAPGFIDVHAHDDRALLGGPDMVPKVSQGVTTVVVGNCGISLAPSGFSRPPPPPMDVMGGLEWYRFGSFGDYVKALEDEPPAVNAACLTGHMTLRVGTMDTVDRPAGDGETPSARGTTINI